MKLFYLIIISLSLNVVSALPALQLESESYQPHEAIIGTIEGTSSILSREDLKLFQERRELTVDKEIYNVEGKYYFYINLPNEGEYSLNISNLEYESNGVFSKIDISKKINVKNILNSENKTEILNIRPGIVRTYSKSASIYLSNIGTQNISIEYLGKNESLNSGEIRKIDLELNKSFDNLKIKSYREFNIPLIYLGVTEENNQTENISEVNQIIVNLTSTMKILQFSAVIDEEKMENFTIVNLGKSVENISLRNEMNFLNLSAKSIDFDENKKLEQINFSFKINKTGLYHDRIIFYFNNTEVFSMPIEIIVYENEQMSFEQKPNVSSQEKTCSEVGGNICASNENCDGDYTWLESKICCFETCKKVESESMNPLNVLVGIVIFLIVSMGVFYFYKRIKGVQKQTPDEKITEMSKE